MAAEGRRRINDPLARSVARLPVKVRTKLVIAFVGTSLLLVAVGVLGQLVLAQSNDRVADLGALQVRASQYAQLQAAARYLREVMAQNAGPDFNVVWPDFAPELRGKSALAVDLIAVDEVIRIEAQTAPDRLGFPPPPQDRDDLLQIRRTAHELSGLMTQLVGFYDDEATIEDDATIEEMLPIRADAERLATDLYTDAAGLANGTRQEIKDLIARNASSFSSSRTLFISVAAGALLLALMLGLALSWSLVRPIQRINERLAAIASGDFSGTVAVENRDELGALSANVNRMNDELQRLYSELEAVSRHK